jgi:FlaG/FlaF family flagellin (archaellin)
VNASQTSLLFEERKAMNFSMKVRSFKDRSLGGRSGPGQHRELATSQCAANQECGQTSRTVAKYTAGAAVILLVAMVSGLSGCASSTVKPNVESISLTDQQGVADTTQPTSLAVSTGTYLEVNLTDDPNMTGANWSVSCGSALPPGQPLPPGYTVDPSCGTFSVYHTLGGPIPSYVTNPIQAPAYLTYYTAPAGSVIGGTVTLTASSTLDPSRHLSVTLQITGGTTPH